MSASGLLVSLMQRTEEDSKTEPPEEDSDKDEQSSPESFNAESEVDETAHDEQNIYVPQSDIRRHLAWKRRRETWVPSATVVVSFVAVLIIIGQSFIYDQQRQIMHRQVQLTEESLRVSERAYVSVASLTADLTRGEVLITLENLGKLPASKITVQANAFWANWSNRKLEPFPEKRFDAGEVKLFPGSLKMRVVVPLREFNAEEIVAIRDREKGTLFVVGTIDYEDGFGYSDVTKFNFEYISASEERWIAVSTPVASMEEDLASRIGGLPPIAIWKSVSTPGDGRRVTVVRAHSPDPSRSPTPSGITRNRNDTQTYRGSCGCSCSWDCELQICQFTCQDCSITEQVTHATSCCEEARKGACPQG